MKRYDEEKITEYIKAFQDRILSMRRKPDIYFDADNTLYMFSTYGNVEQSLKYCYTEGFYRDLSIFPEGPDVIRNLQRMGFNCNILTTVIKSPYCLEEKRNSFKYYFPMIPEQNIYFVVEGQSKIESVPDVEHSILIDDYHVNINQWFEAGGLGVKKSYSKKIRNIPTVHSLIDIFSVLYQYKILGG